MYEMNIFNISHILIHTTNLFLAQLSLLSILISFSQKSSCDFRVIISPPLPVRIEKQLLYKLILIFHMK
uniref:Uncharacterized protein n=1 Tax=Timema bartmani TaxID=61472 RepID=A0A7R9I2D1_9NEOP|nr:unnamed protein product [Timema bartmani]